VKTIVFWNMTACSLCTKERKNFSTSTLQVKRELGPKHWHPPAELHDITYQKTVFCITQNINTIVTQRKIFPAVYSAVKCFKNGI